MQLHELQGKNICILGFGREGQSVANALRNLDVDITIADRNEELRIKNEELHNYEVKIGSHYLAGLDEFDIIIKSPGIPPCKELEEVKDKVTNSTQIFLDTIAETGAKVIGVTGSKGKSTTASLIYEILKAGGKDVHLVGNIGKPAMDFLEKAKEGTWFVMEMSSYQLMDISTSPHIAVITTFFPEHLDYHGTLENYLEAKKHITRFQTEDDFVFYNSESDGAKDIADESNGTKVQFSKEDSPVAIEETHLIGIHNSSNIAAAFKVTQHLEIEDEIIVKAIKNFKGLPHRLQSLGIHHGIEWIDDSISTTPETTIAALDALGDDVETIILGGQDRGNDFTELGKRIFESSVKNVILIGESSKHIKQAIEESDSKVSFHDVKSIEQAVSIAKEQTPKGTICLLSPASPSYGLFENFEERGEAFKESILKG